MQGLMPWLHLCDTGATCHSEQLIALNSYTHVLHSKWVSLTVIILSPYLAKLQVYRVRNPPRGQQHREEWPVTERCSLTGPRVARHSRRRWRERELQEHRPACRSSAEAHGRLGLSDRNERARETSPQAEPRPALPCTACAGSSARPGPGAASCLLLLGRGLSRARVSGRGLCPQSPPVNGLLSHRTEMRFRTERSRGRCSPDPDVLPEARRGSHF